MRSFTWSARSGYLQPYRGVECNREALIHPAFSNKASQALAADIATNFQLANGLQLQIDTVFASNGPAKHELSVERQHRTPDLLIGGHAIEAHALMKPMFTTLWRKQRYGAKKGLQLK